MTTQAESRAAKIRSGEDLTEEDMIGLQTALATTEGRAKYAQIMKQIDATSDFRRKDELIYYSCTFWRDNEFFQPGKNRYAAAHQSDRRLTNETIQDPSGIESHLGDIIPNAVHATSLWDPFAHDVWRKRENRISDITACRETINEVSAVDDPFDRIGSANLIRFMIDVCKERNLLIELFLILQHWKIEVSTFVDFTEAEASVWAHVGASREATPENLRGNVRVVASTAGVHNFVVSRVTAKLIKAITNETSLPADQFQQLLGGKPTNRKEERPTVDIQNETLTRFDTREEWETFLFRRAEAARANIKRGNEDGMRILLDEMAKLIEDLRSGYVLTNWTEKDANSVQAIINAVQARLYG